MQNIVPHQECEGYLSEGWVVLSSLGAPRGGYQTVRYVLGPRGAAGEATGDDNRHVSAPTRFALLALSHLWAQIGYSVSKAVLLLTAEAKERFWPEVVEEARAIFPSLTLEGVDIPEGGSESQIWTIFETVRQVAARNLIVDVTAGLRSLPMTVLSAVRFLAEAGSVESYHVFYGAFEAREPDGTVPFFDLTALVRLDAWARAVRRFRESFDTKELAERTAELRTVARLRGSDPKHVADLGRYLQLGLPLEAGSEAWSLARSELAARLASVAAPARVVAEDLQRTLESIALRFPRGGKKSELVLDQEELEREELLVEGALAAGDIGRAGRLAREWMVNRILLSSGWQGRWLERRARAEAERALAAAVRSEDWVLRAATQYLMDLRNALAHCGFTPGRVIRDDVEQEFMRHWEAVTSADDQVFVLLPEPRDEEPTSVLIGLGRDLAAAARAAAASLVSGVSSTVCLCAPDARFPQGVSLKGAKEVRQLSLDVFPRVSADDALQPEEERLRAAAESLERQLALSARAKVTIALADLELVGLAFHLAKLLVDHLHEVRLQGCP